MSKNKQPKHTVKPDTTKTPKVASPPTGSGFTWSFSILDKEGAFGWNNCQDHGKFLEILSKKGQLECINLAQLAYQGSHSVPVSSLDKEAQKRLCEINLDDTDSLFSFRLTGTNRIWCVQHDKIMRVLWWDPEHKVCPSIKKHT